MKVPLVNKLIGESTYYYQPYTLEFFVYGWEY